MVTPSILKKALLCLVPICAWYQQASAMPLTTPIQHMTNEQVVDYQSLNVSPEIIIDDHDQIDDIILGKSQRMTLEVNPTRGQVISPNIKNSPRRRNLPPIRRSGRTGQRPPIRPSLRRFGTRNPDHPSIIGRGPQMKKTSSESQDERSFGSTSIGQRTTPQPARAGLKQGGVGNPLLETENQEKVGNKSSQNTSKNIEISKEPDRKSGIDELRRTGGLNNSAHAMHAPVHPEGAGQSTGSKTTTKSSLILGGAISGSAICFFLILMIVVMRLQRTTQSRSQGSIKEIKAKEQAKKRRVPRMKSMREVRDTIFTSFRKVRKPRPRR